MKEYELYHTGVRKQHKYIKKIGNRYFYSEEEITKYLKSKSSVDADQERGKKRTTQIKTAKTIQADQERGKARTKQFQVKSPEYLSEQEANSKKNNAEPKKKKKTSKTSKKTLSKLKDKAAKGKAKAKKFYKTKVNPGVSVSYDEAQLH